jgi:hypothetical protein
VPASVPRSEAAGFAVADVPLEDEELLDEELVDEELLDEELVVPDVWKTPYMKSKCVSHWNLYMPPAWNVTVHVGDEVVSTPVAMSTPGPDRWMLCSTASSITRIV